jgi:hypothetical protein
MLLSLEEIIVTAKKDIDTDLNLMNSLREKQIGDQWNFG